MKIFLNIEADDAESLGNVLQGLVKAIGGQPLPIPASAVVEAAEPTAEEPARKTRGPNKAKPTAETAAPNTGAAVGGEVASSSTAAATDEPPAITHQEVRDQIIDLLNDWTAAVPDNPAIRTDILGPLLKALDAEKIGGITPDKYASVPGLIDESRAKLKAVVEARAVEE